MKSVPLFSAMSTSLICRDCFSGSIPISPIYRCRSGHKLCGNCHQEGIHTCRICQQSLYLSILLVENFSNVENPANTPCRNWEKGCHQIMKPVELKPHLLECDFRPITCKANIGVCSKRAHSPKMLFLHWKDVHRIEKLEGNPVFNIVSNYQDSFSVSVTCQVRSYVDDRIPEWNLNCCWPTKYFEIKGIPFFLHRQCVDGIMYAWLTRLGTEAEANNHQFDLEYVGIDEDNNPQLKWRNVPIHCIQFCDAEKIIATGDCTTLEFHSLKWSQVISTYGIKIDVSKKDGSELC